MGLIADSFLVVPLLIILIVNFIPKSAAEKISLPLAGLAALLEMAGSIVGFTYLGLTNSMSLDFSIFWDLTGVGAAKFSISTISLVMLFCVGFTAFMSVMTANKTMNGRTASYTGLLMALVLGLNGMVIVTDLFSLYVFLEIVGIASFVMIAIFKTDEGLEGAFKYLVMSALASILVLTGLAMIFMQTGTLEYAKVGMQSLAGLTASQSFLVYAGFVMIIAGFAIKTGAAPFHYAIPDAYQGADSSVSMLLSGIVIKIAGIYGLIVLTRLFNSVPAINITLEVLGIVSILVGAFSALRQNDFKRMIAYSSVSQAGYILLGISTCSVLGLVGALFHVFNHATAKCTFFTNAEAVKEETGSFDMTTMGGLEKKMPVANFSAITAFLSTAGIPPFSGFWSKFLIILALWAAGMKVLAGIALCASIITAAYMLRMQKNVFFGKLPEKFADVKEAGGSIKFAEILLTIVTIAVGVAFPLALAYLRGRGII